MSTILDYMVTKTADPDPRTKVLKPQLDSNLGQQIMQNMESVMKSLKRRSKHKKHRQKKASKIRSTGDAKGDEEDNEVDSVNAVRVEVVVGSGNESDEEPLASLKQTWMSKEGDAKDSPVDKKKNAFQMLMLNGKSASAADHHMAGNEENCAAKGSSPGVGKRRLSSGKKEQVKRGRKPKVEGSQATTDVSPKSPAKKRRKKKLFECFVETIETKPKEPSPQTTQCDVVAGESELASLSATTPSRPRRSCASNVKYSEETTTSPKSLAMDKVVLAGASTPQQTPTRRERKLQAPSTLDTPKKSSVIVIDVEGEEEECGGRVSSAAPTQKLAPLFYKALPKPSLDVKVREARQSFLMSDIPEKMRQEMDKKKQLQEEMNIRQRNLFPEVSHVPAPLPHLDLLVAGDEAALFPRAEDEDALLLPAQKFHLPPQKTITDADVGESLRALTTLKTEHQKKQLVRQLKADGDGRFPAFKFYKMLAKRDNCEERQRATFPEKFRPAACSEFVFNLGAVKELREYLEGFSASATDTGSSYDTDDEWSNSMDGLGGRQALVLYGGCSTGKTSAVYAIANELNYNVIEINASSKRNGSKVLHKLMEATQSHKLGATVNTQKLSLSRKIVRRMEREETKMSIVFIEDVDVIFAEDNGFLAAITQLMSLTKRPIIVTTNNREAANLKRTFDSASFKFLKFRRPGAHLEDCLTYLHLVGVVQGCNFEPDYLRHLFDEVCGRDLRKALLHLNFIAPTREIALRWSGESARVELPYINLNDGGGDATTVEDLVVVMENLCVADGWRCGRDNTEEEFQEVCVLGGRLLGGLCDGNFYPDIRCPTQESIYYHTSRQQTPKCGSKTTAALDVEPLLRAICRSERVRKEEQRSTSKFSHYLLRDREQDVPLFGMGRTLKEDLEFFSSSCTTFQISVGDGGGCRGND